MEIGLREWLIISGAVVVLLIVIDGWRRMRGTRNQLRMDIQQLPADMVDPVVDEINPELPNGGARRLCDDSQEESVSESAVASVTAVALESVAPRESSTDSTAVTVAETGEAGRCEPTFDLTDLRLTEDGVADHAYTGLAEPVDAGDDVPESDMQVDPVVPESVLGEMAASVVEEDIMTSAALFEAIEQSRQKRSITGGGEAQKEAAENSEQVVEMAADESPVLKPDPLLRPLPDAEADPIAKIQVTESVKPIYLHDDDSSTDPLMRGVEDEELEVLESVIDIDTPDIAVQPPVESALPEEVLTVTELGPVAEMPQTINDITDNSPSQSPAKSNLELPADESHDEYLELELPAEFVPQVRSEASIISFAAVREAVGRTETVVVFPEKKDKPVTAKAEQSLTGSPEAGKSGVSRIEEPEPACMAESDETSSDSRSGMTVQGGSLRQQPDPANVLVVTVVANKPGGFDGKLLLQLVLACGMRFGEMDIFHRLEDGIDSGAVQFSMANATGTGVFDIDTMDTLNTRAVSFFMSMEEPREVMNALECMLATAETVASHMKGELVDDNRLLMRPQTQEHYRQRVRDFEMRNLRRRSG